MHNSRQRGVASWAGLGLSLLVGLAGGVVGSRLAVPPPAEAQGTVQEVTTRRLVLVDARGNLRAELGPITDSVSAANPAVGLTVYSGTARVSGGPDNRVGVQVRVENDGRGLIVGCAPDEGCTSWPPRATPPGPAPAAEQP